MEKKANVRKCVLLFAIEITNDNCLESVQSRGFQIVKKIKDCKVFDYDY